MTKQEKLWTIQWHIAADGTVIKERSRGDQLHERLFQSYSVSRRLKIEDLDALEERLRRYNARLDRLVKVLLYVDYAAIAGVVLGLVLLWLGISTGLLAIVSFALVILLSASTGSIIGVSISRQQRMYRQAGFETPNGVTIAARETIGKISEPGAAAGRKFAAVRA